MTKSFFKNLNYFKREVIENNEKILVNELEIQDDIRILDPNK